VLNLTQVNRFGYSATSAPAENVLTTELVGGGQQLVGEVEGGLLLSDCDGTCCRLDIFHDGVFGSICDDSVAQTTAEVACRQLGFAREGASFQVGGPGNGASGAAPGSGAIWLDDLRCAGTEFSILDCPRSPLGDHNCIHAEDLGLCCPGGGDGGNGAYSWKSTTTLVFRQKPRIVVLWLPRRARI